jgi:(1->4)-alpha-D-glucan 1-alpha-D-glucosylmutase
VRNPLLGRRVFRFIRDMLLLEYPPSFSEEERAEQRLFAGKFQQVTSPVAAKGIEDTALYVDNRLTSLNEVGGQPDVFGVSINALHKFNANRQERWPFALSPLSTHDTKRSEDVRARLNVLSEIPDEWWSAVLRWREMNAPLRRPVDDLVAPDVNEEYLFYQAILGAWPLEPYGGDEYRAFVERIQAYMTKALHEAKIHTSWINPNEEYDQAVAGFVADIFDEARSGPFLDDFARFRRRVVHFGLFNSLAQTLLKIASPGVADTYQGSEIWDFSLVDPDNRRPVDYEFRARMLADLKAASAGGQDLRQLARDLVRTKEDGRIKLYVHYQALQCCRAHPGLFNAGPYAPLLAEGQGGDHVFAFLRCHNDSCAVIAVPRLLVRLAADTAKPPLGAEVWGDTHLPLPETAARLHWRNLFTGEKVNASKMESATSLLIADVFRDFPVALLLGMP